MLEAMAADDSCPLCPLCTLQHRNACHWASRCPADDRLNRKKDELISSIKTRRPCGYERFSACFTCVPERWCRARYRADGKYVGGGGERCQFRQLYLDIVVAVLLHFRNELAAASRDRGARGAQVIPTDLGDPTARYPLGTAESTAWLLAMARPGGGLQTNHLCVAVAHAWTDAMARQ